MRVFITGLAGYVGSHIALSYLDAGDEVVGIDNFASGHESILPSQATFYRGNIADMQLLEHIFGKHSIDSIVHCAAHTVVPESMLCPGRFYENNTVNTYWLVQAAQNAGIENFIFSSTAAVYGIPDKRLVEEDDYCHPINPYGWSKLMAERILIDMQQSQNMKFAILRYFNVAGADPHMRSGQISDNATHLIKVACEAATGKRDQVDIFGTDYDTSDGTCVRDYIHVSDLAEAHRRADAALREGGASNFILNCGYGEGASVREVLETVKAVAGRDIDVQPQARREGDPQALIANAQRIKAMLNWCPKYNRLTTIVDHALKWEQSLKRAK